MKIDDESQLLLFVERQLLKIWLRGKLDIESVDDIPNFIINDMQMIWRNPAKKIIEVVREVDKNK